MGLFVGTNPVLEASIATMAGDHLLEKYGQGPWPRLGLDQPSLSILGMYINYIAGCISYSTHHECVSHALVWHGR